MAAQKSLNYFRIIVSSENTLDIFGLLMQKAPIFLHIRDRFSTLYDKKQHKEATASNNYLYEFGIVQKDVYYFIS